MTRDFVQCQWPLPDVSLQGTLFETGGLGGGGRRYTITRGGRLVRHTSEEVPAYKAPRFTGDVELPIHGDLHLTSRPASPGGQISIVVRFAHGLVQWVKRAEEMTRLHEQLSRACKNLPQDYKPWGEVEREDPKAPRGWWNDCSVGCRHFFVLQDAGDEHVSLDWGVCVNSRSHRHGLLTFEHQGCPAFEYEYDDEHEPAKVDAPGGRASDDHDATGGRGLTLKGPRPRSRPARPRRGCRQTAPAQNREPRAAPPVGPSAQADGQTPWRLGGGRWPFGRRGAAP